MHDMVLASLTPAPRIWSFYPTDTAAERDAGRANLTEHEQPYYRLMSWQDFVTAKHAHYLASAHLEETTEERFWEALEVLPPMNWVHGAEVETFMVSEPLDQGIYAMYAKMQVGGRYRFFTKQAIARDRSTWITAAAIREHIGRANSQA